MSSNSQDTEFLVPVWLDSLSRLSPVESDRDDPSNPPDLSDAIELPHFLIPDDPPPAKLTAKDRREMREQVFAIAFEWVINRVARGGYITWALQDYHIEIDPVEFRRWVMRDPQRKSLYNDAMECNADYDGGFLAQLTSGVDRNGIPYDPAFINAASNNLKWKMSKHNRKQYGDVKQIDLSGGISVTAALAEAQNRVLESRALQIDEEIVEVLDEPTPGLPDMTESDDDE